MDTLSSKFSSVVKSIISGFDRIVFKGMLMPIVHSSGMQYFLSSHNVLNKEFKSYAIKQSQTIIQSAEDIAKEQSGTGITYIRSLNERKESLAHDRQKINGIKEGLIGVWSCVESCNTFKSTFDPQKKYPTLRCERSRCKHLYYYFDDPIYGFMSVRLQTWAPYEIQIALNGREWLRRSLDAKGCGYVLSGNKFLHIDNYELAQELLDAQLAVNFEEILNGFLPSVFPQMPIVVGEMSYYWTLWQSEMAKDYIFESGDALKPLMRDFLRHALITGTGERILQYFGNPVKANGQPHPRANPDILSRANSWYDGLRVRHWNGRNSVKLYNEHNVLRFEMTMNDPAKFKIYRHTEGQEKTESKKLLVMRKGIADIHARASVSLNVVNQFTEQMATLEEKTPFGELLSPITKSKTTKGKKFRALDVLGKDKDLLLAISDPVFNVCSVTNTELQKRLRNATWAKDLSDKQLSRKISRLLRLLREHAMIRKLPNQRKYILTAKGRKITTALNAALAASVNDLLGSTA